MTFAAIFAMAVFAGVAGSMVGVGGGIVVVPMLTLAFGAPVKVAIATSLISVIATSSAAQTVFVTKGLTNLRLGMSLEVMTTLGAIAGGVTAVLVSGRVLEGVFAAVLVYVAYAMNRRGGDVPPERTGVLEAAFVDPASGRRVEYGVRRFRLGAFLSFFAGNISGLIGLGGGAFKVPIMNVVMGVPLKATIATSNLMIGVTAATGAVIFYGRGYVDVSYAVPAALGVLLGARIGPLLAVRLRSRTLSLILQVLLVVFAVLMAVRAVMG
jgi:uncharacterized membrane protein YfcA